jgi:hypothetical protein
MCRDVCIVLELFAFILHDDINEKSLQLISLCEICLYTISSGSY